MKALLFPVTLALTLFFSAISQAEVVRPAPDFSFVGPGKKSLRALRGQPVVLFLADSADNKKLRKQLSRLRGIYQQFAGRGVVFVAALQTEGGNVPTDIPVVLPNNGPAVTAAYGLEDGYKLVIIGKDGNQDFISDRVVAGTRLREVIQNSFEVQKVNRRELPRKSDR
jgi:hypothetical protein